MGFQYGVFTHRGNIRENNEDFYDVNVDEQRAFAIVADGMGGHQSGEIASRQTVKLLTKQLNEIREWNDLEKVEKQCSEIVEVINNELYTLSKEVEELRGMGTTLTFSVLHNHQAIIGHIGDSRCYVYTSQGLTQITKDHSVVQEMYDKGELTREEMDEHPQKNLITRAVATSQKIIMDHQIINIETNDVLLLCSDGLTNEISDKEIERILQETTNLSEAAERLGQAALNAEGRDNITVILIQNEGMTEVIND